MRKIPTLFIRDPLDRRHVTPVVSPGCEWVLEGEGVATRKWDGTCVMFAEGNWYARREVKPGKTPPPMWIEVEYDETTGKRVGWEPAEHSGFWRHLTDALYSDQEPGTYELCGPKINGNPEHFDRHVLIRHGVHQLDVEDRSFDGLRDWFVDNHIEGIVFWHPDGAGAKIKRKDFT